MNFYNDAEENACVYADSDPSAPICMTNCFACSDETSCDLCANGFEFNVNSNTCEPVTTSCIANCVNCDD
jgi:hypothetical protein